MQQVRPFNRFNRFNPVLRETLVYSVANYARNRSWRAQGFHEKTGLSLLNPVNFPFRFIWFPADGGLPLPTLKKLNN